jgi:hypothetical protein
LMLIGNLALVFAIVGYYGRQVREERLAAEAMATGH